MRRVERQVFPGSKACSSGAPSCNGRLVSHDRVELRVTGRLLAWLGRRKGGDSHNPGGTSLTVAVCREKLHRFVRAITKRLKRRLTPQRDRGRRIAQVRECCSTVERGALTC